MDRILLLIFIFILYCTVVQNIIYLDDNIISVFIDKIKVNINGRLIDNMVTILGTSGAFIVGSKIGYSAFSKLPISALSKTAAAVSQV